MALPVWGQPPSAVLLGEAEHAFLLLAEKARSSGQKSASVLDRAVDNSRTAS